MLTVYTAPHTRGSVVEWFVKEFNIPHELKVLDKSKENDERKSDWYKKINPFGLVPSIMDDSVTLYESGAILLYLQNKYVGPLEPVNLGKLSQWILLCNSTMEHAMLAKNIETLHHYLEIINEELLGRDFLCGKSLSAADFALGSLLLYMIMAVREVDLTAFPQAYHYALRMLQRDANPMRSWPGLEELLSNPAS
eukprot:jgi/Botrbrau1/15038/Bobra.320_2s0012.1